MASEESNIDEMDSLFEGMVLFDPTQPLAVPEDQPTSTITVNADDLKQQSVSFIPPPSPAAESSTDASVSQPLDENLFSDLTLVTPPIQTLSEPSPVSPVMATTSPSTKTISRQASTTRKKKKAAGLRIGYKKEDVEPITQVQSSPVVSQLQSSPVPTTVPEETRNNKAEKPPQEVVVAEVREVNDGDLVRDDAQQPAVDTIGEEEGSNSSIELKFEQIKSNITENLNRARELVDSVSAMRKQSIRRRRKAAEDLSLASARYRELERQLEEACETEDFETADRLSEELASADSEKEQLAVALRDADAKCDAVDSKMLGVLDLQIAAEEECASLLQKFATDAKNDAELLLRNAEVMSSRDTSNCFTSVEEVEVKRMELDIESHVVNEARLALNDSIDHLVEDDRRERELLLKKKEVLTDELEKLLALVKQKGAELTENESNIEKVEKRIADAGSGFQEAHSSLSSQYNNLQSELLQVEVQNEALSRKMEEIDNCFSQEQGRGVKIQELAETSVDESNMYHEVAGLRKSLVQFIERTRGYKVVLAKTGDKLTEDVHMLKQEISNARASLQELSTTKTSIQQEIESFKHRLLFIDKRVPELEAEKKVAASVRNFKEAARIAAETKALNVEKEDVQTKMEGASSELGKLEGEISDTVARLHDTEVQLSTKEKELAVTRVQMLLLIAGAATCERSAALELGDTKEAEVLLGEAEVAESEARKLKSTYNFEDKEFDNLPKHFISMELVSNLTGKKLAELAASAHVPATCE